MGTLQGSAIISESVRNRDTKVPGIGIGIEFCSFVSLYLSGVGDTIGIGPESRYQRAWYRNRNRILHIPGSQYRSRYRIFLFLGTPLNKFGHFFIFYLITFAKSWYQYRNRYRILPIPGSRIGIGIAQTFNLVSES